MTMLSITGLRVRYGNTVAVDGLDTPVEVRVAGTPAFRPGDEAAVCVTGTGTLHP